jgi:hypothetical protein
MPVAVLLLALVILAAGIGGTSDFTGARWFPKSHGSLPPVRPGIPMPPTGGATGEDGQSGPSVPSWVVVIAFVLVAILLTVFVWRWWRSRSLPADPGLARSSLRATTQHITTQLIGAEPEAKPEAEKLVTGVELALEVLDQGREPADAVVRAWLGLQQTAERSGIVRRAAETPTEFTSRILNGAFVDDRAVSTLLRLYLQARFGDHPVTAQDLAEVRVALQQLLSSWQPAGGGPTAGGL